MLSHRKPALSAAPPVPRLIAGGGQLFSCWPILELAIPVVNLPFPRVHVRAGHDVCMYVWVLVNQNQHTNIHTRNARSSSIARPSRDRLCRPLGLSPCLVAYRAVDWRRCHRLGPSDCLDTGTSRYYLVNRSRHMPTVPKVQRECIPMTYRARQIGPCETISTHLFRGWVLPSGIPWGYRTRSHRFAYLRVLRACVGVCARVYLSYEGGGSPFALAMTSCCHS